MVTWVGRRHHPGYKGNFLLMKHIRHRRFDGVAYGWFRWPINRVLEKAGRGER